MRFIKKIVLVVIVLLLVGFVFLKIIIPDEFKSQENPASNSPLDMFDKSAVIFYAITIYGTNGVPAEKLKHAAEVTAQWLDNNQDGQIDDKNLQKALIKNKAVVIMSQDGFSMLPMLQIMSKFSGHALQDLSAEETNNPSRRDASQEEIHHIIMNAGFQKMLPKTFSDQESDGSKLYKIWKYANDNGFYAYDDPTCDDACKTTEFVYLATAAYLDSQADLFSDEMRVKTRMELKEKLPGILELFESNAYIYPIHIWPDGNYKHAKNIKYFGLK
ncbi:hypothetical protein [Maribacter antarcticus]|uniref:hypothetical protein n=1 Tax=Maribacter antarcticus TaxID=505250 RepID=UPI001B80883D|nr:hypothetical protein [Maribacter antarcticus]